MKLLLPLLFFSVVLSFTKVNAQFFEDTQLGIGYYGNYFVNPGVSVSLYKPIVVKENFLGKLFKKNGIGQASINARGNAGFYWDPFSKTDFHINATLNYRQYLGKFIGFQIDLGPGFLTSFTSDIYKLNRKGELKKRPLHADLYFAPNLSLSTFIGNRSKTWLLMSSLHFNILAKYNSSVLPTFAYEISYIF